MKSIKVSFSLSYMHVSFAVWLDQLSSGLHELCLNVRSPSLTQMAVKQCKCLSENGYNADHLEIPNINSQPRKHFRLCQIHISDMS